MKVLITGASGFLGRNTLLKIPSGWETVAMYRNSSTFLEFVSDHCGKNVKPAHCNLTEVKSITDFIASEGDSFDLCIYLSANSNPWVSISEPIVDFQNGPYAMMNFLSSFKIKRLIYFSSGAVYYGLEGGVNPDSKVDPKLPYSVSKLSSELYIKAVQKYKQNPKEYVIVRFFDAFGPYENPRRIFTKLVQELYIKRSSQFQISGDGKNLIDCMYSEDAAEGIIHMAQGEKNLTVDFCTGNVLTIEELVYTVARVFNVSDFEIKRSGDPAEYILFKASPKRMQEKFKYSPKTSLKDGILKFAKFQEQTMEVKA